MLAKVCLGCARVTRLDLGPEVLQGDLQRQRRGEEEDLQECRCCRRLFPPEEIENGRCIMGCTRVDAAELGESKPFPYPAMENRAPTTANGEEAYRVARHGHSPHDEDEEGEDEEPRRKRFGSFAIAMAFSSKVKNSNTSENARIAMWSSPQ